MIVKPAATAATALLALFLAAPGQAQDEDAPQTYTGPNGGTATVTTDQRGTSATGSVAVTGPQGRSGSASGSARYDARSDTVTASGSATGPQGSTASGSATHDLATGTGNASGTGPRGRAVQATYGNGQATLSGPQRSRSFARPRRPR